jgi:hypothetical protein
MKWRTEMKIGRSSRDRGNGEESCQSLLRTIKSR